MKKENRHATRITAGYKAIIIRSGERYGAIVDNLSESGLCLVTDPMDSTVSFSSGESIELHVETLSGETLRMTCQIKWVMPASPHNARSTIGAEIISPPWEELSSFL